MNRLQQNCLDPLTPRVKEPAYFLARRRRCRAYTEDNVIYILVFASLEVNSYRIMFKCSNDQENDVSVIFSHRILMFKFADRLLGLSGLDYERSEWSDYSNELHNSRLYL